MSGFQRHVNTTPAPAVSGDFASSNPRTTVLAGPGGFVAGTGGVNTGHFAWIAPDSVTVYNHGTATNAPHGFVHREQQALIQTYLAEYGNNIPVGFPVTLHNEGDFWATVGGSTAATLGAAVYANYADGAVTVGSASTGASVTAAIGSTSTGSLGATFTCTGADTLLTLTGCTGLLSVGDNIVGTGIPEDTVIVSQTSGSTGGNGTYVTSKATTASGATATSYGNVYKATSVTGLISIGETISGGAGFPVDATVATQVSGSAGAAGVYTLSSRGTAYTASASGVTTFSNLMNVTAVASGTLSVGEAISGSGVPSGAVISSQVSGATGGVGLYTISIASTAYAAGTTVTVVAGVLTNFKCKSTAAVGELVKISSWS